MTDSAQITQDDVPNPDDNGGNEPELLAGKYKTQEDLVAGYKELEKKLHTQQDAKPAATSAPATPGDIPEPTEATPEPLNLSKAYEEFKDGQAVSYTHLTLPTNREVMHSVALVDSQTKTRHANTLS